MTTVEQHQPGGGRRALARKRRRRRQRLLVAVLLVLALLGAAAVATVLANRETETGSEVEPQGRTQRTLLMQVRTPDAGGTLASALLASDTSSRVGSIVLVPPQVIVDVPSAGSLAFGLALTTGQPTGARDALADLLGVTIDGTWVLEAGSFGTLVDQLGGITATVDVPIVQDGAVVVPAGEQVLDGARALQLLGYLGEGEQEQARLARVQEVLDGVLAALPDDQGAVAGLIEGLSTGSVSSEPPTQLAGMLLELVEAEEQ